MITRNADLIRRLNILLALPNADLGEIIPAKWKDLLDGLYWAVFNDKNRVFRSDVFHIAATRDGVRAAQEGIRGQIYFFQHAEQHTSPPILLDKYPSFELAKSKAYLFHDEHEGFFVRYVSTDFPTMAYRALFLLLERLKLWPSDLLTCAYEKCGRVFVPLRKPHAKARKHFCSRRCGNIVSARESRLNTDKGKERERSHKGYKARVEKRGLNSGAVVRRRRKGG
jgi:hypothetical protein